MMHLNSFTTHKHDHVQYERRKIVSPLLWRMLTLEVVGFVMAREKRERDPLEERSYCLQTNVLDKMRRTSEL